MHIRPLATWFSIAVYFPVCFLLLFWPATVNTLIILFQCTPYETCVKSLLSSSLKWLFWFFAVLAGSTLVICVHGRYLLVRNKYFIERSKNNNLYQLPLGNILLAFQELEWSLLPGDATRCFRNVCYVHLFQLLNIQLEETGVPGV